MLDSVVYKNVSYRRHIARHYDGMSITLWAHRFLTDWGPAATSGACNGRPCNKLIPAVFGHLAKFCFLCVTRCGRMLEVPKFFGALVASLKLYEPLDRQIMPLSQRGY